VWPFTTIGGQVARPSNFNFLAIPEMCPHCISITEALVGIVTARAFEQLFTTFADLLILEHMFPATLLQDPLVKVRARRLTVALAVMFLMLNLAHIGAMIACGVYASFAGEFPLPPSPLQPSPLLPASSPSPLSHAPCRPRVSPFCGRVSPRRQLYGG
jgi:hypothetical protein